MKTLADRILLMVAILIGTAQCVTESGDIGYFYGIWSLKSMEIDSKPADIVCSDYFWKFQGNVIFITVTDSLHQYKSTLGSWSEADKKLTLNFTYKSDNEGSEDSQLYNPPAELRIPPRRETTMKIITLTDKDLTLDYTTDDGESIIYTLKKLK